MNDPQVEWGIAAGQASMLDLLNVASGREPWPGAVVACTAHLRAGMGKLARRPLHEQALSRFTMVARLEIIRRREVEGV